MDKYVALSLGWGVQSFTLAAMAALGEIEKPNICIHADTGHEFSGTYKFAEQWTWWLKIHGLNIVTVINENHQNVINGRGGIRIPAYSITPKGKSQSQRQCTGEWKIAPMRRYIQNNRDSKLVEMWLGISKDEYQRMRDSDVKYITNRYPLIEKRMSRDDCKYWLESHDLPVPPRSSCVFCPFHNTQDWRNIKASAIDWQEAVKVDNQIRRSFGHYELFVHPSRQPLEDVDFRTLEEMGQMRLWDEECGSLVTPQIIFDMVAFYYFLAAIAITYHPANHAATSCNQYSNDSPR